MMKKEKRVNFFILLFLLLIFIAPLNNGLEEALSEQETTDTEGENLDLQTTDIDSQEFILIPVEEIQQENEETGQAIFGNEEDLTADTEHEKSIEKFEETKELESTLNEIANISEEISIDDSVERVIQEEANFSSSLNYTEIYADLQEISQEKILDQEIEPIEVEKIKCSLQRSGSVQIEYECYENDTTVIQKEERVLEDDSLEVKVFSNEHFETPLRVYNFLPIEASREEIRIIWENENKLIEDSVEYYDLDSNGLYERVSWIVPHLSEQFFRIVIERNVYEINASFPEIEISLPIENATLTNPLTFSFGINYTNISNLDCFFSVDSENPQSLNLTESISNFSWPTSLENGVHEYKIQCSDYTNLSIITEKQGFFRINESLSISGLHKVYLPGEIVALQTFSSGAENLTLRITKPNSEIIQKNIFSGAVILSSGEVNLEGQYLLNITTNRLDKPISAFANFSIAKVTLIASPTSAETGNNINLALNMSSAVEKIQSFTVYYADGKSFPESLPAYVNANNYSISLNKAYTSTGNYTPYISFVIADRTFQVNSNKVEIKKNSSDVQSPKLTLLSPEDEEKFDSEKLEFSYKISDNVKVQNCTLKVFNASEKNNGLWEVYEQVFPSKESDNSVAIKTEVANESIINITLYKFVERDYSWEVRCFDNSSNEIWDARFFKIISNESMNLTSSSAQAESYSYSTEVEEMIEAINEFMEKEKTMNNEEKEFVEDLEIIKDIKTYKNRLLQIDQDFKYNLKFVSNQDLRKQRIDDMNQEIEEYRAKIPKSIEILETEEYVKNNLNTEISLVIEKYFSKTDTVLDKKYLNNIIAYNEQLQSDLNVNVVAKRVKVEFFNQSKNFVTINKKIKLDEGSEGKVILEVFPFDSSQIDQVSFLTDERVISENEIYEFKLNSLEEKELKYVFEKDLDLDEIKKIDSVIFSDNAIIEGKVVTGFAITSVFDDSSIVTWLVILILVLLLIMLLVAIYSRMKIANLRNEPNFRRIIELVEESKKRILAGELETARKNYEKMQEIYPVLSDKAKNYSFQKIRNISIAIDKRDILGLVKEYEQAKREFRKEDSLELYEKISRVYKRLPKEYQEKVYSKIVN